LQAFEVNACVSKASGAACAWGAKVREGTRVLLVTQKDSQEAVCIVLAELLQQVSMAARQEGAAAAGASATAQLL
jgi:hypothetical protein